MSKMRYTTFQGRCKKSQEIILFSALYFLEIALLLANQNLEICLYILLAMIYY
jgi:hypothetical protein